MSKESIEQRARELLAECARKIGQPEYAYHVGCGGELDLEDQALIETLMIALTPQWQPIETAPVGKNADGVTWLFLAWGPEGDQSVGEGFRWRDKWFAGATFYCAGQERKYEIRETEISPTHWMPLPSVPEAA
ncbi:DUF551 domain-containing protein [Stenotrophomonas beteli]|uniref:DUF551 domain-containing protein n=1 Tax=Stenotrophomonas beteli TaxID=3384461 RepID=A0A0R0AWB4_9GAMM|nr:DUF551 domain-containing protein [Stenotrophomonas maltophilia]KRG49312.1 hypothetical protein ARC23_14600 [Stenotrophomonas maltophilia]